MIFFTEIIKAPDDTFIVAVTRLWDPVSRRVLDILVQFVGILSE